MFFISYTSDQNQMVEKFSVSISSMSLFPQTCGSTRYVTVSIHNHAQITVSKYSSFLVGNDCNTLHGNEGFPTEKVGQNVFFIIIPTCIPAQNHLNLPY